MKFYSIKKFDNQIKEITKKSKDGYSSYLKDISDFFRNKSSETLLKYIVTIEQITKNSVLKKSKVENSFQKLSSKDGYRVIYVLNTDTDTIYLLYVYPKRGKFGQLDIKQNVKKFLKTNLEIAFMEDSLTIRDIEKDLEIIQ